jgi:hypothetical protein
MSSKKFRCKIEEVPVLGEFIVSSAEKDINDFYDYSTVFTTDYLATIRAKIEVCNELAQSPAITKELKVIAQQLYVKSRNLRSKLNALEKYLKLGAGSLDIAENEIGLKSVKANISRHSIERLLLNLATVLKTVKRNLAVLKQYGLKEELIDEIETQLQEINSLNEKQNELISKRNRQTEENIEKFNNLWISLKPILNTARAIYQGVDETKMSSYIISQLKKRINAKS